MTECMFEIVLTAGLDKFALRAIAQISDQTQQTVQFVRWMTRRTVVNKIDLISYMEIKANTIQPFFPIPTL